MRRLTRRHCRAKEVKETEIVRAFFVVVAVRRWRTKGQLSLHREESERQTEGMKSVSGERERQRKRRNFAPTLSWPIVLSPEQLLSRAWTLGRTPPPETTRPLTPSQSVCVVFIYIFSIGAAVERERPPSTSASAWFTLSEPSVRQKLFQGFQKTSFSNSG